MKQTSHVAHKMIQPQIPYDRERILKALIAANKPVNYEVIAKYAGMDKHAVHRRLNEMQSDGLVGCDGALSPTKSNRPATNYIITEKGRRAA